MKARSLAQLSVCLLVAIAVLYPSPPQALAYRGSSAGRNAQELAALLSAMMLLPVFRWREPRHKTAWAIGAFLAGLLAFGASRYFENQLDRWTCEYDGKRVIVGSETTPTGAGYIAEHPDFPCERLIRDFVGVREDIWTKTSIDGNSHWLAGLYTGKLALAGWFAMALLQAVWLGVAARGPADIAANAERLKVRIFISYRRDDTIAIIDRLYEHLVERVEAGYVFRDIQSIAAGENFRTAVDEAIAKCDFVLVVIGPAWLTVKAPDGSRRIDNPHDPVRVEIETALRSKARVIPLVYNARMPAAEAMPESLAVLSSLNALPIRDGLDFHNDFARLIDALKRR